MKLGEYLKAQKISDETFAEKIKLSRQQVWVYRRGKSIPRADHMERIRRASGGMVTREDWAEVAAERVRSGS